MFQCLVRSSTYGNIMKVNLELSDVFLGIPSRYLTGPPSLAVPLCVAIMSSGTPTARDGGKRYVQNFGKISAALWRIVHAVFCKLCANYACHIIPVIYYTAGT